MKSLEVRLDYGESKNPIGRQGRALGVALPIKIMNSDGDLIAEGLTSTKTPAKFSLDGKVKVVTVKLIWPSCRIQSKRLTLISRRKNIVIFSDRGADANEAWAGPFLNDKSNTPITKKINKSLDQFSNVWLIVWMLNEGVWTRTQIKPKREYKTTDTKQLDFILDKKVYLLQVGGSDVPWRFISLPGSGPCRVLLTSRKTKDIKDNPLKIIVTGYRYEVETLLTFLSKNAVGSAKTMADSKAMANLLFAEKFFDPIAAVVGAYYLLRVEDWKAIHMDWWENLSSHFDWIPDTAIVHCTRMLREGFKTKDEINTALNLFKRCVDLGWPIYREGLKLLQEAAILLRQVAVARDAHYFAKVTALITADASTGASLSFFGKIPENPSPVLWVGMPNTPRRKSLIKPEAYKELTKSNQEISASANTVAQISRNLSSIALAQDLTARRRSSQTKGKPTDKSPINVQVGQKVSKVNLPKANRQVRDRKLSASLSKSLAGNVLSNQLIKNHSLQESNAPSAHLIKSTNAAKNANKKKNEPSWLLLQNIGTKTLS